MNRRGGLGLLAGAILVASPPRGVEAEAVLRVRAMAQAAGVAYPLVRPELRVFKAPHTLELWAEGRRLATYRVGLGHRGLADKVRSGDHLTPEGTFYIASRNRQSAFHLFLGISYPDGRAADRGRAAGLITEAQRQAIHQAQRRRGLPPQFTGLGGLVGLHGGGSGSDWTWGCVALDNPGIEELWIACPLGTPVEIHP